MVALCSGKSQFFLLFFLVIYVSWVPVSAQQTTASADTLSQYQFITGCASYRHQVIDSIISALVGFNDLCDSLKSLSDRPDAFEEFRERLMDDVLQCEFENWYSMVDKAMPVSIRFEKNFYRILQDWMHNHYLSLYQLNFLVANQIVELSQTYKLSNLKAFWNEVQSYALTSGQTFVDVGAGIGAVSFILAGTGMPLNIYITEVNEEYLAFLRGAVDQDLPVGQGTRVHVVNADQKGLGLDSLTRVDRILIRETYHHMKYRSEILQSVKKHLAEDGLLIMVESTRDLEASARERCIKAMRIEQVQEELEDHGFNLVGKKTIGKSYVLQYRVQKG